MRTTSHKRETETRESYSTDGGRLVFQGCEKQPRRRVWILAGVVLLVLSLMLAGGLYALENKGAEQMVLDGRNAGPVPFPHHQHQNTLGDCQVCHRLFPMEAGSINKLKDEGQLARKQVMNKLCIQCHKARIKNGELAGPTSCTQCHRK